MQEDENEWQSSTGDDARYALKRHKHSKSEIIGLTEALAGAGSGGGGGGEGFDQTADPIRIGDDGANQEDETKKFTINIGPGNGVGDGPYNTVVGQFIIIPDEVDSVIAIGTSVIGEASSGTIAVGGYVGNNSNSARAIGGSVPDDSPSAISIGGGWSSHDAPHSVAIGDSSYVIGDSAIAIGASAWASGDNALAIGGTAEGDRAVSIMGSAQAPNTFSVNAPATEEFTAALGYDKLILDRPGSVGASVLVLKSPNGTKYIISVDDDGVLSATADV